MSCQVVGKYPEGKKLLIHGEAVHFSKECLLINDKVIFGEVAEHAENGWRASSDPVYLTGISQEHRNLEGRIITTMNS